MTPSEQPRLLLRKAAQDLAVLDKLIDDAAIDDETLGYHSQQAAEKLIKALIGPGGGGSRGGDGAAPPGGRCRPRGGQ
jgi:HEPN domain-containing protein